jgi:esterase/lipase superfamily enzyme
MLFVTNRRLIEGRHSAAGRAVSFDLSNTEPSTSLFFCRRYGTGQYEEVMASRFFDRLRASAKSQVLLFIHGFNCRPEPNVFSAALELQRLCDHIDPTLVEVVPLIWPCDDDFGLVLDYWDDQTAAEISGVVMARMIGKFFDWRARAGQASACLKHVNILAHSMGNRLLRAALAKWRTDYGVAPALFRSIFMVAADLANECLQRGESGEAIPAAARNVLVYHAADDFALRTSKAANLRNKVVGRRLGHSGPERIDLTAANVAAIDCDAVNGIKDPLGHSYFLSDPDGGPGAVLQHIVATLASGRVAGLSPGERNLILHPAAQRASLIAA